MAIAVGGLDLSMASLRTFLSDHETRVDLLNNEAIASTIVSLVRENPERAITIGVHGDWGAGKSSILEMIEAALEPDTKVLCLKFNGWRFQGFEDAKIALLEGIVTGLLEKRPALTKAGEKVKAIFRRIDWLKVAKSTGGLAVTALTGLPTHSLLQAAVGTAVRVLADPRAVVNQQEVAGALEGLKGLLKPEAESKNVPEEINEFRKAFDELLNQAEIEQLIVLVDDLDRCLPETAIETLEAIRLFVFTSRTAFVVAADEAMIEYSVRKHFPDLPNSSGPQTYARNYLEKLIQVPFRIPALGEAETRVYVALVLAEAALGPSSPEFQQLIRHARDVLKRPWLGARLQDSEIRKALGTKQSETADLLLLSDRIGPTLAQGTSGNPRQVKRFLNSMLLRQQIAVARGFGGDIQLPILAKLMLAEQFKSKFFDQIAIEAGSDPKGTSSMLAALEDSAEGNQQKKPKQEASPSKAASPSSTNSPSDSPWMQDEWVASWSKLEPQLSTIDLRPYVFIANQQARSGLRTALGQLAQVVDALMGSELAVAGMEADLKKLTAVEAETVFEELATKIRQANLKNKPEGVEGLRGLVRAQSFLEKALLEFLEGLPTEEIGAWVVVGWSTLGPSAATRLAALLQGWSTHPTNKVLATTATQTLKTIRGDR
ncbi:MAG TPA: Qat anti-phage system ATPase QatA [Fimbriimonadaceae bacterium]|nr:Qat anti-phage system ATPase QatA [Fimbriimonadaceae bacterium]